MQASTSSHSTDRLEQAMRSVLAIALVAATIWALVTGNSVPAVLPGV